MESGNRLKHLPIAADRHAAWNPTDQRFRLQEDLRDAGEPRRLISLLNAILRPKEPIVDVTLENPFNPQDFQDDKLSILDIKAVDRTGAIYDVEMQLTTYEGLVQRIVFYGCELYAGQLKSGDEYEDRQSGLFDLADQWHPLAGRNACPPCLSPGRRRIGAGLGGNVGDSHAGTGEV